MWYIYCFTKILFILYEFRLIICGNKSSSSYYFMFYREVKAEHPDLTSSTFEFTIPSAGNYDYSSQIEVTTDPSDSVVAMPSLNTSSSSSFSSLPFLFY